MYLSLLGISPAGVFSPEMWGARPLDPTSQHSRDGIVLASSPCGLLARFACLPGRGVPKICPQKKHNHEGLRA